MNEINYKSINKIIHSIFYGQQGLLMNLNNVDPPLIVCNNYIRNIVIYEWICQAVIIVTSRLFRYCLNTLLKDGLLEYQINLYIIKIKLRKHVNINNVINPHNGNNQNNNTNNSIISGTIIVDCFPIFVVSWFILFIMVIILTIKLILLNKLINK